MDHKLKKQVGKSDEKENSRTPHTIEKVKTANFNARHFGRHTLDSRAQRA